MISMTKTVGRAESFGPAGDVRLIAAAASGRGFRLQRRHLHAFLLLVLATALLSASCSEPAQPSMTDDLGRKVVLPARITRVVSLAPNVTEMLFAIGAGDRVAGVDEHSDFPPAVQALPRVGGMQPNIEKIVALEPDLVLASSEGNQPNLAGALAAVGIPLYVLRTDRLAEIPIAMRRLGDLLGVASGEAAARRLTQAVAAQQRTRAVAPRILFVVWTDPLYVAGQSTFTDDLILVAGGRNAVTLRGWPQYSLESLVAAPPDILVYPRGAVQREQVDALLQRLPGLRPRIVPVDEDIFQRPGPRMAEAAAALNAILDEGM